MSEPTETVVVRDANAAHALIGREVDGHKIATIHGGPVRFSLRTPLGNVIGGWMNWGESVEVDALPAPTMWVHLDDLPGNKLPGETEAVVSFYREADGFYWSPDKPSTKPLPPIVDHKVEVLAPVTVVEAPDEVTVRGRLLEAAEALIQTYSPLDFTESRIERVWADFVAAVAALAADRGEA